MGRPVAKVAFKLAQFALGLVNGSAKLLVPLTQRRFISSLVLTALMVATAALIRLFRIELSLVTVWNKDFESVRMLA